MDMATPAFYPHASSPSSSTLPPVRVEVRGGGVRPSYYDIASEEFLIGSVPGCDLRLPGTQLPPVVCLIARQVDGVRLRKLAPGLPVLLNGQPVPHTTPTTLTHGDCISIGAVDLQISIEFSVPGVHPLTPEPPVSTAAPPANATGIELDSDASRATKDWNKRLQELETRERELEAQTRELEADRVLWYRRREEIESELQEARNSLIRQERASADLTAAEIRLKRREEELDRREKEIERQHAELAKVREETLTTRRELHERFTEKREQLARLQENIRQASERVRHKEEQLEAEFAQRRQALEDELRAKRAECETELRRWREQGDSGLARLREEVEQEVLARHRQRAEELDRFQMSLREAAVQLRERKQQFDDELRQYEPRLKELQERERLLDVRREELDARASELQRERDAHALAQLAQAEQLQQREHSLAERETELSRREEQLRHDRSTLDTLTTQYQNDLVRIDRWQAQLETREQQLQSRAAEIDQRFLQFQQDSRELEAQVMQIDAREERCRAEEQRQLRLRSELDERETKLNERAAQLEGQQIALASLRTRLERVREETHAESIRLSEERARLEAQTQEAQQRILEAEKQREQLTQELQGSSEGLRIFEERSALLQQAIQRLRELQQQLATEDERLRTLSEELENRSGQLAEREAMLVTQQEQFREQLERLEADRQALREREMAFTQSEQLRETLQDQLRRRSEELVQRQRELDERSSQLQQQGEQLLKDAEQLREQRAALESLQVKELERRAELDQREATIRIQHEQLQQFATVIHQQKEELEAARLAQEDARKRQTEDEHRAAGELKQLKEALAVQAAELFGQVPELEHRAQAALDRTVQARESLRAQLAELHTYARQSQEDLETLRHQVQEEIERLRQQEGALSRARAEHRLSVSSFRQQLLEWQNRFTEMRQALTHGESQLERREKAVEATSQDLARQAEELQVQQIEVTEARTEMERHLNDMREWYRKKLRELVESRRLERAEGIPLAEPAILPMPASGGRDQLEPANDATAKDPGTILPLREDLDPADRQLGNLLRTLELVDSDTLLELWNESRRQHRPLRQVLLTGGYLSLYQLALIESGNLNGLMLGRFRVLDRLRATARETIYRVFDPRRISNEVRSAQRSDDGVVVLRHLGESEMHDAVHPDEYRQRFAAARDVAHPNIAATLEVLEINGRPAVLQECLRGLSGSEWPAQAGSPGVWYRLLSQAALGLHTAHQAGLIHGQLNVDSFVLTRDGVLKILGVGEPRWLHPGIADRPEPTAEDDLRALGDVAHTWYQLAPKRKGKKAMPESFIVLMRALGVPLGDGPLPAMYPSVGILLEDLDRLSSDVPADSGAWEKLLGYVAENSSETPLLRQSA